MPRKYKSDHWLLTVTIFKPDTILLLVRHKYFAKNILKTKSEEKVLTDREFLSAME